jgi:hypothetical protein
MEQEMRNYKKLLIFLSLIMGISLNPLNAQGCEDSGDDEEGVKVVGYIQPQYIYHDLNDATDMPDTVSNNTFQFKRARIGFLGSIPYDISYYVYLEFSPTIQGPKLLDAFITYKGLGEYAYVSVGQFKSPFSLEQSLPCFGLYTVERSHIVNTVGAPIRDMGLMVSGKYEMLDYKVAIMNGSDANLNDNNNNKSYVGRAAVEPVTGLKLGGSFKYGKINEDNTSDDDQMAFAGDISFMMDEILMEDDGLVLMAEYISSETKTSGQRTITIGGGGCSGEEPQVIQVDANTSLTFDGYWALAVYKFGNFWPTVKYASMTQTLDIEGLPKTEDDTNVLTAGFSYFLNDWTRLQLNYIYHMDDPDMGEHEDLIIQAQVKF